MEKGRKKENGFKASFLDIEDELLKINRKEDRVVEE